MEQGLSKTTKVTYLRHPDSQDGIIYCPGEYPPKNVSHQTKYHNKERVKSMVVKEDDRMVREKLVKLSRSGPLTDVNGLKTKVNSSPELNLIVGVIFDWRDQSKQFLVVRDDDLKRILKTLFDKKQKSKVLMECLFADKRPRYPFFMITSSTLKEWIKFKEEYSKFKKLLECHFGMKGICLTEEDFIESSHDTKGWDETKFSMSLVVCDDMLFRGSKEQKEDLDDFIDHLKSGKLVPELEIDCDKLVLWSSDSAFEKIPTFPNEEEDDEEEDQETEETPDDFRSKSKKIRSRMPKIPSHQTDSEKNYIRTRKATLILEEQRIPIYGPQANDLECLLKRISTGNISDQEKQLLKKYKFDRIEDSSQSKATSLETLFNEQALKFAQMVTKKMEETMKESANEMKEAVKETMKESANEIKESFKGIKDSTSGIKDSVKEMKESVKEMMSTIKVPMTREEKSSFQSEDIFEEESREEDLDPKKEGLLSVIKEIRQEKLLDPVPSLPVPLTIAPTAIPNKSSIEKSFKRKVRLISKVDEATKEIQSFLEEKIEKDPTGLIAFKDMQDELTVWCRTKGIKMDYNIKVNDLMKGLRVKEKRISKRMMWEEVKFKEDE